jgi:uncharacterized protein
MKKNVAILGASPKLERYSNMAQKLLREKGYNVFPINPNYKEIENISCYKNISDIKNDIHTLTVYMKLEDLVKIQHEIINKKPDRVIFNPGTESLTIQTLFEKAGIKVIEACTLVLLKTGQFDKL